MRKKLIPISALVAILCLTSAGVMWTSASSHKLTFGITVTGDSKRKGSCFQASSGTIDVVFDPETYIFGGPKTIGNVTSIVSYSYENLGSLSLVEEILVHIHIDGSFRRLNEGDFAVITLLEIGGCSSVDPDGVQYCVNAYHAFPSSDVGNLGTVTKTGPNTWWVDASIPAVEHTGPGLCVRQWSEGNVTDGFCIPLYNFQVVCTGEISK